MVSWDQEKQRILQQLKQQLKRDEIAKQMSDKTLNQEDDDNHLWAKAIADVQPLAKSNQANIRITRSHKLSEQTLIRRASAVGLSQTDSTILSDTQAALYPVGADEILSYRIRTVQDKVFDALKSGKMPWFEAVDLHGCTIEQAREAVLKIIQMAKEENQTVLKIVHGKGGHTLKTYVNGWLRQHQDVLAFVSAPNKQGGTGAVLVLIKRASKQRM